MVLKVYKDYANHFAAVNFFFSFQEASTRIMDLTSGTAFDWNLMGDWAVQKSDWKGSSQIDIDYKHGFE